MLDIRFIRDNADAVQKNAKNKGYDVDISKLLSLDAKRRKLLTTADELRTRRNDNVAKSKGSRPTDDLIAEGKAIKDQLAIIEPQLKNIDSDYFGI